MSDLQPTTEDKNPFRGRTLDIMFMIDNGLYALAIGGGEDSSHVIG